MKNLIINKSMNYIKKYNNYSDSKLAEIEYGLMGLYLTFSKIIVISIVAIILGIFKEMLIFMFLFNAIRTTAFGLHATKSWVCLLSSILIFIIIPILCVYITINLYLKIVIGILQIVFIYKNAPADTKKRPIVNKKRRHILKLISTINSIIYVSISIIIKNNFISNCLIFSLILENCLISRTVYKIFKLPYDNYISYLELHPELKS